MARARTAGPRVRVRLAGLVLGAAGVALQVAGGADLPRPVPPALALFALAALLTATVARRWVLIVVAAAGVVGLLNAAGRRGGADVLTGAEGVPVAVGAWAVLTGSAVALATTALPAVRARRAPGPRAGTAGAQTAGAGTAGARTAGAGTGAQVLVLLLLAPVCAEYLAAYDDSTGDPVALLAGLLVFVPLYGAPALLIRELARRAGLSWPGVLLAAAAFGVVQAGVVDQSLFSLGYRGIESWAQDLEPTFLAPLGFSAANALNFVGGHVVHSIAGPIALAEGLRPATRHRPWVRRRTLVVLAALYAAASALVLRDSLATESSHASPAQLVACAVLVALLLLAARSCRGRGARAAGRRAPRPRLLLAGVGAVFLVVGAAGPSRAWFAGCAVLLTAAGVLLLRASRSPGWGDRHVLAVAAGALLPRALLAFTYSPLLGEVAAPAKYAHNTALLVLVAGVCVLAARAARTPEPVGAAPG
ncbi:hypothetical protein GTQ99_14395 [Kineococcus sp. T13]|nr:hypothetical protein [Kineococcus vitellinus]